MSIPFLSDIILKKGNKIEFTTEAGASAGSIDIDTSGNLNVGGDLTVTGTTTTINTTNLNVEDKNITLNYSTGDSSSTADGAGITIQDAVDSSNDATFLWDATNDKFSFSHGVILSGNMPSISSAFNVIEVFVVWISGTDGFNSVALSIL